MDHPTAEIKSSKNYHGLGISSSRGVEVAAGSRIQGSPVRAPALPVEGLVVGVALLDPGAGAGGPAVQAGAAGRGLAPAAVDYSRRDGHLHRLAPPARRALALAPRRPRPDQRLRHRHALANLLDVANRTTSNWLVHMCHGAREGERAAWNSSMD